jgi:Holliday junction resolvase-like predicted endonuclease
MAQQSHISIGRLGEDIVCGYLQRRGFHILERNYKKKWGEIDIVTEKDNVLHFVEVKAGTWKYPYWPQEGTDIHRPEDHFHKKKKARMLRAINSYLHEYKISPAREWTADLGVVLINTETKKARVRWIWGVHLVQ